MRHCGAPTVESSRGWGQLNWKLCPQQCGNCCGGGRSDPCPRIEWVETIRQVLISQGVQSFVHEKDFVGDAWFNQEPVEVSKGGGELLRYDLRLLDCPVTCPGLCWESSDLSRKILSCSLKQCFYDSCVVSRLSIHSIIVNIIFFRQWCECLPQTSTWSQGWAY